MHRPCALFLVAGVWLSSGVLAQTIVPAALATREGKQAATFGDYPLLRQQILDLAVRRRKMTLGRLGFRMDTPTSTSLSPKRTWTRLTLSLADSRPETGLTSTFLKNFAATPKVVFQSQYSLPTRRLGPSRGPQV